MTVMNKTPPPPPQSTFLPSRVKENLQKPTRAATSTSTHRGLGTAWGIHGGLGCDREWTKATHVLGLLAL